MLDVTFEPTARVVLNLPPEAADLAEWWVRLRSPDFIAMQSYQGAEVELTALDPGPWRILVDAPPLGRWEKEVVIEQGALHTLEFP